MSNFNFFTTLSALDESYGKAIENILKSDFKFKPTKYMIVNEHGKKGNNSHYHVFFNNHQYKRPTEYNKYFRPLYKDFKDFNKKTIVTKIIKDELPSFLSYYFFKEGMTLDDIIYKGFSEATIQNIFNNRVLQKKGKPKIKFDDAIYKFHEVMISEKMGVDSFCYRTKTLSESAFNYIMSTLIKNNYVTHLIKNQYEISKALFLLYHAFDDINLKEVEEANGEEYLKAN